MTNCVIVSVNDKYVPYLSVLLASIMQYSEKGQPIEVVVLYDEISEENQKILTAFYAKGQFSIRYINVCDRMQGYHLFVNGAKGSEYLSKETYFRLLAPELLPEYDIALYLDCDTIVQAGWQDIYREDISGYLLAGVQDIWGNWQCYDSHSELFRYRKQQLELDDPFLYFNAGVLLLNLQAFRDNFDQDELLRIAASRSWNKHDQDVLNYISKDRVLFLEYAWNMIECPGKKARNTVPRSERMHYEEQGEYPRIIHYASRKPWITKGVFYEQNFWKSASMSPYFEQLFTDFIEEQFSQGVCFEKKACESIRQGKIGVKFIVKCILTWIRKRI